MFRKSVKYLTHNVIVKKNLPSRFNSTPLYVSPCSQLKYLKLGENSFDKELIDFAFNYVSETSNVWDIGANVGIFSFAAASIAKKGSVLAVEPDIFLINLINKSKLLDENKKLNLQTLSVAISDKYDILPFLIFKKGRAINKFVTLQSSSLSEDNEIVFVPTVTLDSLLKISCPDLIKIDVEGAELLVLNGAKKILSEVRPIIYIEVWKQTNKDITEILRKNNYLLFSDSEQIETCQEITTCDFNTIAIPEEQLKKN